MWYEAHITRNMKLPMFAGCQNHKDMGQRRDNEDSMFRNLHVLGKHNVLLQKREKVSELKGWY
jgi:hypothetical protein